MFLLPGAARAPTPKLLVMAAADDETEALRADVAALRLRVQVGSSRLQLLISFFPTSAAASFFNFVKSVVWLCVGLGEGEPAASKYGFELYLRDKGDVYLFWFCFPAANVYVSFVKTAW
jgi:hypothetical protein